MNAVLILTLCSLVVFAQPPPCPAIMNGKCDQIRDCVDKATGRTPPPRSSSANPPPLPSQAEQDAIDVQEQKCATQAGLNLTIDQLKANRPPPPNGQMAPQGTVTGQPQQG